ncbi:MAG: antibiotic ABC transporter ATP-binding protein [Acidobacteria bacterium]|nr:antibiotic ABC transporter ATP-binding protein [Acidobacteriota bacterium]
MTIHDEEVLGKAYDARLMRRLLTYLKPYRGSVVIALLVIIGHSVLQLAQPYLMKLAIDQYIAEGDMAGLNRIALVFLFVLISAFVLEYVRTYTLQLTGQRIMFDLRMEIYSHLQRLDMRFYDRNPVGRLMTRVTTDVDVLNDMFASGIVTVFGDIFMLVGIMTVLVSMDWRLALIAFSVLPLIIFITQWFRRNVRETYRTVRLWIARINAFLQEHISGMATVQLFRREALSYARFEEINRTHRDSNIAGIVYYAVFYPTIEIIGALAASLIIWYGGAWVLQDSLTLGVLVAFLLYAQRFFRPISDMSEKFNMLQAAMASSERIFTLLDTPVLLKNPKNPVSRSGQALGRIEFDRVWFAYTENDFVLRDVSFEVAPGERIGIVGATGAGKTTIINLLMRFYDVTRGRICLDGVDIRELDLRGLRRLFSLVLQDVHLFSGSIASNIRLGEQGISDAAVEQAAASVHADRFIAPLPDGFSSVVAERGANFSVGQKQILSFARALAFDPRILVLDEATSSVDTETELLIQDGLQVLMAGRTTIAIAHRLSTIQNMDKILVLHKGQIRERGTHQNLLTQRGIYHRLYQLQYKDQELTADPE